MIFRIDHYLGKKIVKDIIELRFFNGPLSSFWNRDYIYNIQITLKEPMGTDGRGGVN